MGENRDTIAICLKCECFTSPWGHVGKGGRDLHIFFKPTRTSTGQPFPKGMVMAITKAKREGRQDLRYSPLLF